MQLKNSYNEVFDVEIDGWCYGIGHFPGQMDATVAARVLKEIAPVFRTAVANNHSFNIVQVADKLSCAFQRIVDQQDVARSIIDLLHKPAVFTPQERSVINNLVEQVEVGFGKRASRIRRIRSHGLLSGVRG